MSAADCCVHTISYSIKTLMLILVQVRTLEREIKHTRTVDLVQKAHFECLPSPKPARYVDTNIDTSGRLHSSVDHPC